MIAERRTVPASSLEGLPPAGTICELALRRGTRAGHGWVGAEEALLVTPAAQPGLVDVTTVPTRMVVDVLARMNDVSPRPRPPAEKRAFGPGELATAVARRTIPGLREHWSATATWEPGPRSTGTRTVEVLDTDEGLWLVVPDGPSVELWPTTPTHVFRLLAALLPRDDELA